MEQSDTSRVDLTCTPYPLFPMPLAWRITVFRQQNDGSAPAQARPEGGTVLANWQCQYSGGRWLDELVAQQLATKLRDDGYPSEYTARAEHILPRIHDGQPPDMNKHWLSGEGDYFVGGVPRNHFDVAAMDACRPDEWLFITLWDES